MVDLPTVTEADRSQIKSRIDQSLNYTLNGPGAYWPDGGSRSMYEIISNLLKYRGSLPPTEEVNDPDGVYRSLLFDLDAKLGELSQKIQAAGKFPDDLDVLPPFPDDHVEVQPQSPLFPKESPKDLLNRFNNPISLQPNVASAPDRTASPPLQPDEAQDVAENGPTRFLAARTYDPSQGSPFVARPTPFQPSPDGSLSLNDAYLEYLRRLSTA